MDTRDYASVYVDQHSRCALCGAIKPCAGIDALVVDADPDLGGIRSLLCWRCMEVSRSDHRGRREYLNDVLNSGYRCDGTRPVVKYTMKIPNTGHARVRTTLTEVRKQEYVKRPFVGVDGKAHIRKGR